MKKTIITIITAMLAIGAMAQVNAVGIPFGISKVKAVEMLRSKYGNYADYARDRITYVNFRLDGVAYERAHFFFDNNMKFTNAMFEGRHHTDSNEMAEEAKAIAAKLSEQYLMVNLVANGVSQRHKTGDVEIMTCYRGAPRQMTNGKPAFFINIIAYITPSVSYNAVRYSQDF